MGNHRTHHREHSNADTSDDTASEEHARILCTDLEAGTQGENQDCNHHTVFSGNFVRQIAIEEGAEPCTKLKRRNEPALDRRPSQRWEVCLEVLHDQDRTHDSLIITVHHTA